jgi:hypothetical protein
MSTPDRVRVMHPWNVSRRLVAATTSHGPNADGQYRPAAPFRSMRAISVAIADPWENAAINGTTTTADSRVAACFVFAAIPRLVRYRRRAAKRLHLCARLRGRNRTRELSPRVRGQPDAGSLRSRKDDQQELAHRGQLAASVREDRGSVRGFGSVGVVRAW